MLWKRCASLWDIMERYRSLQDITEHCGSVVDRYGSNTELLRNVMEPLWKILILPITNLILNFAHH